MRRRGVLPGDAQDIALECAFIAYRSIARGTLLLPTDGVYDQKIASYMHIAAWPWATTRRSRARAVCAMRPPWIVGADHTGWLWTATAGGRFQEASAASLTASEVFAGAGAGGRGGPLQLGSGW
jgi:OmpA-OmpF porin, OOP family